MATVRPKISVVVPVYNAEQYIIRCVESILGQTCQDFELVLLDDGSTDGSVAVLQRLAQRDPLRVRVYSHPNMGAARTRNRGIELATGEYLCFVDADDRLDPDFCQVHLEAMEREGADVVVGGYRTVVDGRVAFTFAPDPGSPYTKYLVSTVWGKLYRTSFVVEHGIVFPDLVFGEDTLFTVEGNRLARRVCVVPYVGYSYVTTPQSTSQVYMRGLGIRGEELADLVTRLCGVDVPDSEADAYDYFVMKTVVFLLLHFGKGDTPSRFFQAYQDLVDIVGRRRSSALRLRLLLTGPKGERAHTRLAVAAFAVVHRLRMVKLCARFYCRGPVTAGGTPDVPHRRPVAASSSRSGVRAELRPRS